MLSDALRNCRNADFWRVAEEWGDEECRQHVGCIDQTGSTLLHLAIDHCDSTRGDISIVETILDWGAPLEQKKNSYRGTALAAAIEIWNVAVVRLLLARGADRVAPCTPGGQKTPLDLALAGASHDNDELLVIIRDGLAAPSPPPSSDALRPRPQSAAGAKERRRWALFPRTGAERRR